MAPDSQVRPSLIEQTLPDVDRMSASVHAIDLRNGETIVSHAPEVPMLPASNAKLVTAARALADLGPSYQFDTTVDMTGEVRDGHLVGDLILTGRGAPDLSQADLLALSASVAEAGIEKVAGEIVVDASLFDDQSLGPGWTWDDGQFPYGAKCTPLALKGNTVDITVAHRNGSVEVDASPTSDIVRLTVDVTPDPDADGDLWVYKERASEVIRVEGSIQPDSTIEAESPIDDPMMHAASVFRDCLRAKGVEVDGWTRIEGGSVESTSARIGEVESAPLSALIAEMFTHSDNFVAEQLARTIAAERTGLGTWDAWGEIANTFLKERGSEAVRMYDGSGMSRYNLLSAKSIVGVLEWAVDQPWGETYLQSLPRGGTEGTVEDRLTDVAAPVRAKTGTLSGVRTLSGYVEENGEPAVLFSCLLTNLTDEYEPTATDHIDELVGGIVETADIETRATPQR